MKKLFLLVATVVFTMISGTCLAAPSFFEGKTIHIIVGHSAGGGFDVNARMIARYMGKYVPGNPTIIVENMTGAGGLVSANYLYKAAKPDGLTIGHNVGNLVFNQVIGQPGVEFDARKFEYLGAAMQEHAAVALSKASGITSVEKWFAAKTPLKLGGVGTGSSIDNTIRLIKAATGLPIKLVSGYKGTPEIRMAIESGELSGGCLGWDSMKSTWHRAIESGDIVPVLQAVSAPYPDIPHVPLVMQYAKTDEARKLVQIIYSSSTFSRPFTLPPNTPKERVQMLRNAFQATMKDKDFIAENERANMGLEPATGEEVEQSIAGVFKLDPTFLAKLNNVLFK